MALTKMTKEKTIPSTLKLELKIELKIANVTLLWARIFQPQESLFTRSFLYYIHTEKYSPKSYVANFHPFWCKPFPKLL